MRWGVGEIIDNLVAIKKPSQKNHLLNDEQEAPACLLVCPRLLASFSAPDALLRDTLSQPHDFIRMTVHSRGPSVKGEKAR